MMRRSTVSRPSPATICTKGSNVEMRVSPHKKRRGTIASSTEKCAAVGGVKLYRACWPFKFGKQRRSKEDGNKGDGKKKNRRAIQMPGMPSGECLGAGKEAQCRCGKHNPFARGRR